MVRARVAPSVPGSCVAASHLCTASGDVAPLNWSRVRSPRRSARSASVSCAGTTLGGHVPCMPRIG